MKLRRDCSWAVPMRARTLGWRCTSLASTVALQCPVASRLAQAQGKADLLHGQPALPAVCVSACFRKGRAPVGDNKLQHLLPFRLLHGRQTGRSTPRHLPGTSPDHLACFWRVQSAFPGGDGLCG